MNLAANGTSSISMSVEINGIVYAGKGKMQLGLRENGWPLWQELIVLETVSCIVKKMDGEHPVPNQTRKWVGACSLGIFIYFFSLQSVWHRHDIIREGVGMHC